MNFVKNYLVRREANARVKILAPAWKMREDVPKLAAAFAHAQEKAGLVKKISELREKGLAKGKLPSPPSNKVEALLGRVAILEMTIKGLGLDPNASPQTFNSRREKLIQGINEVEGEYLERMRLPLSEIKTRQLIKESVRPTMQKAGVFFNKPLQ